MQIQADFNRALDGWSIDAEQTMKDFALEFRRKQHRGTPTPHLESSNAQQYVQLKQAMPKENRKKSATIKSNTIERNEGKASEKKSEKKKRDRLPPADVLPVPKNRKEIPMDEPILNLTPVRIRINRKDIEALYSIPKNREDFLPIASPSCHRRATTIATMETEVAKESEIVKEPEVPSKNILQVDELPAASKLTPTEYEEDCFIPTLIVTGRPATRHHYEKLRRFVYSLRESGKSIPFMMRNIVVERDEQDNFHDHC